MMGTDSVGNLVYKLIWNGFLYYLSAVRKVMAILVNGKEGREVMGVV